MEEQANVELTDVGEMSDEDLLVEQVAIERSGPPDLISEEAMTRWHLIDEELYRRGVAH
jgi:hypothetical protein